MGSKSTTITIVQRASAIPGLCPHCRRVVCRRKETCYLVAYASLHFNVESTWLYKLSPSPVISYKYFFCKGISGISLNLRPPCQLEKGFPAAHAPAAQVHHQGQLLSNFSRPSSTSASCAAGQVHINVVGAWLCATKVYAVGISPTIHTSTANLSTNLEYERGANTDKF